MTRSRLSPALTAAALTAVALACSHEAPPPETPTQVPTAPPASTGAPRASASAPAPPAPEAEAEPDCSEENLDARLKMVEKAVAQGNRAAIYEAIEQALVVRPRHLDLWTRKARMLREDNDLEGAASAGQILTEIEDGASALGWLLMGLGAEASKHPTEARAYLARSAALDPQGEGARKLGAASRCTALAYAPDKKDAIDIVKGWMGVFKAIDPDRMGRDDQPAPTGEAEAKKRACVHSNLSEVFARDVCDGKGPWPIQTGHMHFHDHMAVVLPLPGNRFAIVRHFTGMPCRGGTEATVRLLGDVIQVESAGFSKNLLGVSACDDGPHDMLSPPCISATDKTTSYYDARTGKALLHLDDRTASEKYELKGPRLRRTGPAGCDETLDLKKLPPTVGPRPS